MENITARIHSIESCGTVDGPGVRTVIFMQGCCLRCAYCHNPDTWETEQGEIYTVQQLLSEIVKYKSYMRFSGGGVTISGGEPLLQAAFLKELFKSLHAHNINCAIDTSGCILSDDVKDLILKTDLILLDFKMSDPEIAKDFKMTDPQRVIDFLQFTQDNNKPVWLRHVLIPGITNSESLLESFAGKIAPFSNIEKIELLPYHKIGEYKWQELGYTFEFSKVPPASKDDILAAKEYLKKFNVIVT